MAVQLSLAILLLVQFVQSYPYPSYSSKRYTRASYRPAYVPLPVPYAMSQNYDDARQEAPQSLSPYYYYYPIRSDRRMSYVDDGSDEQSAYPYGQEMWYEGGNDAMTAAANAAATREAILQNLIIAQMFEDAAASAAVSGYPYYQAPPEDYENKDYKYGVKTTGLDEKERARQFLKNEEDEEVKELENLRKAKESNKEAKRRRKQKNKEEKAAKQMQESLGMAKRQDPSTTSQTTAQPVLTDESLAAQAATGRKTLLGQKEVMMPQPARPARYPLNELSQRLHSRSEGQSAYQTIKQLLEMENDYRKTDESRLQKRFVTNEEQLIEQLKGLKRTPY